MCCRCYRWFRTPKMSRMCFATGTLDVELFGLLMPSLLVALRQALWHNPEDYCAFSLFVTNKWFVFFPLRWCWFVLANSQSSIVCECRMHANECCAEEPTMTRSRSVESVAPKKFYVCFILLSLWFHPAVADYYLSHSIHGFSTQTHTHIHARAPFSLRRIWFGFRRTKKKWKK